MADFPDEEPHGATDLLHLLSCPTCRSWAIARLLGEQTPLPDDETHEEIYAGMWARLEERTPELIEETRLQRETAERLFAELMQTPPGRRLGVIRQSRFRSLDLLDLLLEVSHARQLAEPACAAELARLAVRLAHLFGAGDEEAAAALPHAYCLGANARRLESRRQTADLLLAKAVPFLAGLPDRAFQCRTLALLRWEQGRIDEAEALLQHAACLFATDGQDREVSLCLMLLGLVLLEEGGHGDTLSLLADGWAEMDRDGQPFVALKGGLALAACLGEVKQGERARGVLREAWKLYSRIADPEEMVRVYGWEGRALARLGDLDEVLHVLESVRQKLLAEPSPAEAALVSLDLTLALAESGRAKEIEALAGTLETYLPRVPALALAAGKIRLLARLAARGEPRLREAADATAVTLRRMFRACGLRLRPLPFA